MTYKVCYWDAEAREQRERDATTEEIAEIEDRKASALIPTVPQSVTRFQGLAALDHYGVLETVEAIIDSPDTPKLMKLAFNNALTFERDSASVASISSALGLTPEMIDTWFIYASTVKA